jgi:hypothetical protein
MRGEGKGERRREEENGEKERGEGGERRTFLRLTAQAWSIHALSNSWHLDIGGS